MKVKKIHVPSPAPQNAEKYWFMLYFFKLRTVHICVVCCKKRKRFIIFLWLFGQCDNQPIGPYLFIAEGSNVPSLSHAFSNEKRNKCKRIFRNVRAGVSTCRKEMGPDEMEEPGHRNPGSNVIKTFVFVTEAPGK